MSRALAAISAGVVVTAMLSSDAVASGHRALLVGIDDYTSAALLANASGAGLTSALPNRHWRDLAGAVRDAQVFRDLLVHRFGFAPGDIRMLTDPAATREGILEVIQEHLVRPTRSGDEVVFFFAGHGSQVVNSRSREPDGKDETLVAADSMAGAADLRDRELRRLFNRVLDRGGRLTVILDSCHSGSGLRGLPPRRIPRFLAPDSRAVADGTDPGPAPEERGALVLSAAQDFEMAWETVDAEGRARGAFSLALSEALAAAGPGEPAEWVFQRAKARLQTAAARQEPVLAGPADRRAAPLFGTTPDEAGTVVAVAKIRQDGTVLLQGGWAHGLGVGTVLTPAAVQRVAGPPASLRVTAVLGPASAEAVVQPAAITGTRPAEIPRPGDLFRVASWTVADEPWLRVWIPRAGREWPEVVSFARQLRERSAAPDSPWTWVEDPLIEVPTHLLTWETDGWVLSGISGASRDLGRRVDVAAVVAALTGGDSTPALFVHLPAPVEVDSALDLGHGRRHDAVARLAGPAGADYHLVVRLAGSGVEAAWVHPAAGPGDEERGVLPLRSDWSELPKAPGLLVAETSRLQEAALRLARIRAWLTLESPPGASFPYTLALRRSDGLVRTEGTLTEGETYGLWLRLRDGEDAASAMPRSVYAFALDGFGRTTLLFPPAVQGNVENRMPQKRDGPGALPLGPRALFTPAPPFGVDTYFLLTSDEPIPVPSVLDHDGVRTRGARSGTALEELLTRRGATTRGPGAVVTPRNWSIERWTFRSVPPTGVPEAP